MKDVKCSTKDRVDRTAADQITKQMYDDVKNEPVPQSAIGNLLTCSERKVCCE